MLSFCALWNLVALCHVELLCTASLLKLHSDCSASPSCIGKVSLLSPGTCFAFFGKCAYVHLFSLANFLVSTIIVHIFRRPQTAMITANLLVNRDDGYVSILSLCAIVERDKTELWTGGSGTGYSWQFPLLRIVCNFCMSSVSSKKEKKARKKERISNSRTTQ